MASHLTAAPILSHVDVWKQNIPWKVASVQTTNGLRYIIYLGVFFTGDPIKVSYETPCQSSSVWKGLSSPACSPIIVLTLFPSLYAKNQYYLWLSIIEFTTTPLYVLIDNSH